MDHFGNYRGKSLLKRVSRTGYFTRLKLIRIQIQNHCEAPERVSMVPFSQGSDSDPFFVIISDHERFAPGSGTEPKPRFKGNLSW